jgi:hypothetical protein
MAEERASVTLAARSAGADRLVGVWLVLAAALLGAGLFLPAVTVRKLFVLAREYSLSQAVFAFLDAGEVFLFAVTFAFTIAFPAAKVAVCLALWFVVRGGSASAACRARAPCGRTRRRGAPGRAAPPGPSRASSSSSVAARHVTGAGLR